MFKWIPLLALFALPAFAEDGGPGDADADGGAFDVACIEEEAPVLLVGGEPVLRCETLLGSDEDRLAHATWRSRAIESVSTGEHAVTVTHRVSSYQAPRPIRLDGMRVLGLRKATVQTLPGICSDDKAPPAPHEEWVAEIWLGPELATHCGAEIVVMRMDDQVGYGVQVLAITESSKPAKKGKTKKKPKKKSKKRK
jgi:hypothetical protein